MSGKTLYYEYDENGRLKYLWESAERINSRDHEGIGGKTAPDGSIACGGTITLTECRYTNAGCIKEILTANGIYTSYTYDEDGNVSRLTIGDGTEGACFTTPSCSMT